MNCKCWSQKNNGGQDKGQNLAIMSSLVKVIEKETKKKEKLNWLGIKVDCIL